MKEEEEAKKLGAEIHKSGKTLPMTNEFFHAARKEQEWMIDGWMESHNEFWEERFRELQGRCRIP